MEDNKKKIFKDVKAGDKVWFVTGAKAGVPSIRLGHVTEVKPDADNALVLFDTDVQNVAVPVASLFKDRIEFGAGETLTSVHTAADAADAEYNEGQVRYNAENGRRANFDDVKKRDDDGNADEEYTVADLVSDVAKAFISALAGVSEDDDCEEPIDLGIETELPPAENPPAPDNHLVLTEKTAAREVSAPSYPSVPAVLMITVNPSGCEKLDPDYCTDPAMHTPNPLYLDHGVHYLHDILIPDFRRPASLPAEDDSRFFGDDTEADAAACMIEDWIDSAYPELARLDYGPDEDWFYEVLPGSAIGVDTNTVELNPFKED